MRSQDWNLVTDLPWGPQWDRRGVRPGQGDDLGDGGAGEEREGGGAAKGVGGFWGTKTMCYLPVLHPTSWVMKNAGLIASCPCSRFSAR